jgi:hypothetical protein
MISFFGNNVKSCSNSYHGHVVGFCNDHKEVERFSPDASSFPLRL